MWNWIPSCFLFLFCGGFYLLCSHSVSLDLILALSFSNYSAVVFRFISIKSSHLQFCRMAHASCTFPLQCRFSSTACVLAADLSLLHYPKFCFVLSIIILWNLTVRYLGQCVAIQNSILFYFACPWSLIFYYGFCFLTALLISLALCSNSHLALVGLILLCCSVSCCCYKIRLQNLLSVSWPQLIPVRCQQTTFLNQSSNPL